jgi:cell division protein FtsW (lipid II flippase)
MAVKKMYFYNMEKGVLILIGTFVVVGVLHIISMRAMRLSETKKTHFRKFFWYFYGIIFMISGGINLIDKGAFHWSFFLQFIIGLLTIILNLLGKIEPKAKQV